MIRSLRASPAVAVLGPRQSGKSTLARRIIHEKPGSIYLDLERPSDLLKLSEPELYFELHRGQLICLDEIQRRPDLFPVLRSTIDAHRRPGQFLILGSASKDLIRQSSESLAGRIAYFELHPFLLSEVGLKAQASFRYWLRGGFPESFLARSTTDSADWCRNFIRTFMEQDVPQLGFRIPAVTLARLWTMCAHRHGQPLNQSRLGEALGMSHTTVRSYLDLLSETFMIRLLPPLVPNLGKRVVKSPRIYLRDSGILHALLDIQNHDDLLGHPIRGASWEGMVIENVLGTLTDWRGYFYRSATGAELDLVLEKGRRRVAVECKLSSAPEVKPGFWNALADVTADEAWIIAPVKESYPIRRGVTVSPLLNFIERIANLQLRSKAYALSSPR